MTYRLDANCHHCKSPISQYARVCPHCHRDPKDDGFSIPTLFGLVLLGFAYLGLSSCFG